jgi:hypothetical protein
MSLSISSRIIWVSKDRDFYADLKYVNALKNGNKKLKLKTAFFVVNF